jgi:hypothetical protein
MSRGAPGAIVTEVSGRHPRDDDEVGIDDPRTFQHEGRGEDIDPAVVEDEWSDARSDQLLDAADADDPVEALEDGLWADIGAHPAGDVTELADRAAPPPPEEAAVVERAGVDPTADELTVGLPAGANLDAALPENLVEAELVAISEGDPETAAILAEELEERRRRR